MTIFLDKEFRCHITSDGTMLEIETDFFNGKCPAFIEGYRFVPEAETWTGADGTAFTGEMVSPWKPYGELKAIQNAVDHAQEKADEKQMELLDIIENLILEG